MKTLLPVSCFKIDCTLTELERNLVFFLDSGLNVSSLFDLIDLALDGTNESAGLILAEVPGNSSTFDLPPGLMPSNGVGGTYGWDCQLGNLTKSARLLIRLTDRESPSLNEIFSLKM